MDPINGPIFLAAYTQRVCALVLAVSCVACAGVSDPAGFSIVSQDRYDFMPCREIIAQRVSLVDREKTLVEAATKAESSFGGLIASYAAYRSELTQVRAQIAATNRGMQKNGCDASKK